MPQTHQLRQRFQFSIHFLQTLVCDSAAVMPQQEEPDASFSPSFVHPRLSRAGTANGSRDEFMITSSSSEASQASVSSPVLGMSTDGEARVTYRSKLHLQLQSMKIRDFFQQSQLCDVTLRCKMKRIHAHRVILAGSSDYFAAMFTGGMEESERNEVEIQGIEPDCLEALVNYCYTAEIDVHESNAECLLAAACLLQLADVVEACSNFMSQQLHPTNCLGIRSYALAQGCQKLHIKSQQFTLDHFMEVIKHQEFLLLPPEDMYALLSSENLNVSDESVVFQALVSWLSYDLQRKQFAGQLLPCIRIPLLSPEFITDHIENNPLFRDERSCQELIMEAMKFHLLPERRQVMQVSRTKPRKSTVGRLFAVGGIDANKGAMTIESYNLLKDQWTVVGQMTNRRLQFGVAVMQGKICVVGGREGLKTLSTFECWDPDTGLWTSLEQMNSPRHGLGVCVLAGPLYAVGGHDGWSYLASVERFDPTTRSWSVVAEMHSQRSTLGVAVLDGRIYAIGGRDGSQCLRSVESYNPHTNKWTYCSSMAKRRGGIGVGVVNGYIIVCGGLDAPSCNPSSSRFDCVERYDYRTDQWTTIARLSIGRDAIGVCSLGDLLFACGGYNGQQYLKTVECYDPQKGDWIRASDLNSSRGGSCVVCVPNKLAKIPADDCSNRLPSNLPFQRPIVVYNRPNSLSPKPKTNLANSL